MTRRLQFRSESEDQLKEAIHWYEQQRKGLGKRFRIAAREVIQSIRKSPESRQIIHPPDVRKVRVDVFPYAIYYRVFHDRIRVISVFRGSRDPATWQKLV